MSSDEAAEALPKEMLAKVEAALYAAGRPISVEDIARVAGTSSERKAAAIAREIARSVNGALQAVEVVEYSGPRFAMQLKAKYTQTARKFATRPLLSRAALRTLSFIAFFQPITSSDLVLRRSSTVYQHLKELEAVGFIVGERQGRSRAYKTTARFAEYFGLSTELTTLKRQLESRTLTLR
ncbi:MAG: SMC-Scp complex subunit ScpB [Nitrososphaerota archaeon]|nr:SMC-Scp complex subunit ScpB [Nitrososphaerota archaeon]MDG6965920.1 SMC-Scp complex subunit ScpB [Nitrososphaerota archaeon]MDG6968057.1 SMC-Scp complex subunit ScpB [Nitrososphaerota archaeon]MDG6969342.1 SMC-Scp complex subunit ScpB [Nitrososphaerota archaeon]MDG6973818.1 SMC-Scp complex subunit ScpB [Nitrososphaerota archaeon]